MTALDARALLPYLILAYGAVVVLVVGAFWRRHAVVAGLAALVLAASLLAPPIAASLSPRQVTLQLANTEGQNPGQNIPQRAGALVRPLVRTGARVSRGQKVGEYTGDRTGAHIHASIDGVVTLTGNGIVIEQPQERSRQHA